MNNKRNAKVNDKVNNKNKTSDKTASVYVNAPGIAKDVRLHLPKTMPLHIRLELLAEIENEAGPCQSVVRISPSKA